MFGEGTMTYILEKGWAGCLQNMGILGDKQESGRTDRTSATATWLTFL